MCGWSKDGSRTQCQNQNQDDWSHVLLHAFLAAGTRPTDTICDDVPQNGYGVLRAIQQFKGKLLGMRMVRDGRPISVFHGGVGGGRRRAAPSRLYIQASLTEQEPPSGPAIAVAHRVRKGRRRSALRCGTFSNRVLETLTGEKAEQDCADLATT